MRVRAKKKLVYRGKIYEVGEELEMDEATASKAAKYNEIEIVEKRRK